MYWKNRNWYLRIEELKHNHFISNSKVFSSNCSFLPGDIIVIKDNLKVHILPIKTLIRLHNFNAGKYFGIQDLYNTYTKISFLIPIPHLLQKL